MLFNDRKEVGMLLAEALGSTAEKISSYLLSLEGAYYVRFDQLDDNEVVALLRSMHVKDEKADECSRNGRQDNRCGRHLDG